MWLYPLVVLPLHIFEQRYRQMIEDSLDGPGRIVLATLQEESGSETGDAPPFHPVAGYGEIGRHERLEDGRYRIWLVGLKRVWAEEVESDRLYRMVSIRPAEEIEAPRERAGERGETRAPHHLLGEGGRRGGSVERCGERKQKTNKKQKKNKKQKNIQK